MPARANYVSLPPRGLIIAVQHYPGDEEQAFRLARLLADIQPAPRKDVSLMFCGRFDSVETPLFWDTFRHCSEKFSVGWMKSKREATGHPDGSWALWAGTIEQLAAAWQRGETRASAVFMAEADGVPLRRDWIDVLLAEHAQAIRAGKRITGDIVGGDVLHTNGSMIIELSAWIDHPSLHQTPSQQAFDLYHAPTFISETRPTRAMLNLYGSQRWSDEALAGLAKYSAFALNVKDDSALSWAERTLTGRQAPLCEGCGLALAAFCEQASADDIAAMPTRYYCANPTCDKNAQPASQPVAAETKPCPPWCGTNTEQTWLKGEVPPYMACSDVGSVRHRCFCSKACLDNGRPLRPVPAAT